MHAWLHAFKKSHWAWLIVIWLTCSITEVDATDLIKENRYVPYTVTVQWYIIEIGPDKEKLGGENNWLFYIQSFKICWIYSIILSFYCPNLWESVCLIWAVQDMFYNFYLKKKLQTQKTNNRIHWPFYVLNSPQDLYLILD